MKVSKQVKLAFRVWKSKTELSKISLKDWAKNQVEKDGDHKEVCFRWLGNKGVL